LGPATSALGLGGWLVVSFAAGVWRRAGFGAAAPALGLFIVQLVLNALWSYLFFGLRRPGIAFFDIVALWLVILVVVVLFWHEKRGAGALMLPYLVWVGFAACLNFAIWRLNAGLLPD
jgi:translocator protein